MAKTGEIPARVPFFFLSLPEKKFFRASSSVVARFWVGTYRGKVSMRGNERD